eukprot:8767494-Alexandrium_andersonii.AAC.1
MLCALGTPAADPLLQIHLRRARALRQAFHSGHEWSDRIEECMYEHLARGSEGAWRGHDDP